MIRLAWLLAALPALSHAAPHAVEEVPRLRSATVQLDHARGKKRALVGTQGEARRRARTAAVAAYRAVREHHPRARSTGAEAAFRAAELLRAGGDLKAAGVEFEVARKLGRGTVFRVRAALEIGHVERRRKRSREALDAYLAVIGNADACACYRDEASLWAGRVWAQCGRDDDARRAWKRVADEGEDPVDRVRAFDQLALLRLARGDPEGAAGELGRCRLELSEIALELTERGERTRRAMQRMRATAALQRAVREGRSRAAEKKLRIDAPVSLDIGRRMFHRMSCTGPIRWAEGLTPSTIGL